MKAHRQQWDWRLVTLVLIAVIVPTVSPLLLASAPAIQQLELLVYDRYYRTLLPRRPSPQIVIVGFDDAIVSSLPAQQAVYPIPRSIHARVVDNLRIAGARVVGFDEAFTRASPDDKVFAGALQRQQRVVVATELRVNRDAGQEIVSLSAPAPLLRPHVTPSSNVLFRRLGKVRGFFPSTLNAVTHTSYPHLSVALAANYWGKVEQTGASSPMFHMGTTHAPLNSDGEILIRFAGPAGTYKPVPYEDVLTGAWKQTLPADFFQDKIVLIGSVSSEAGRQDTPRGEMASIEILANATQTLLQQTWIRHWSFATGYLVKLGMCLLLVLSVWRLGKQQAHGMEQTLGAQHALPVAAAEVMLWLIISQQLLSGAGLWVDTVEPLGALAVTYLLVAITEAHRMRRLLNRSMPPWVADQMLQTKTNESPKTVEQEAAVIFCDIRKYTTLCETLPSAIVEDILHQYFMAAEQAARRWGTDIDKFVGDEVMLYYVEKRQGNRPGQESVSLRAIRWAFAMQEAAEKMHESGIAGETGFQVGVGIATGIVRIGTVGAQQRIQHTLIGDAVNTASRLQGLTKEVGCKILISENTYQQIADCVEVQAMGEVSVRGKQEPQKVYCPLRIMDAALS